MKFLTFILALYTLVLSIAPCNDVHEGQVNIPLKVQAAQEHHQEDNDACSPFCLCSCCQGFVLVSAVRHLEAIPFLSRESYPLYAERFSSVFANNCWQPPRLG